MKWVSWAHFVRILSIHKPCWMRRHNIFPLQKILLPYPCVHYYHYFCCTLNVIMAWSSPFFSGKNWVVPQKVAKKEKCFFPLCVHQESRLFCLILKLYPFCTLHNLCPHTWHTHGSSHVPIIFHGYHHHQEFGRSLQKSTIDLHHYYYCYHITCILSRQEKKTG